MTPTHDEQDHNHDQDCPQQDNLPMRAHERLHSRAEVDADDHDNPGPDRGRDGNARGKHRVADLERAGRHRDRDAKAWDVAAEDDRRTPYRSNHLSARSSRRGAEVDQVRETSLGPAPVGERPTPPCRGGRSCPGSCTGGGRPGPSACPRSRRPVDRLRGTQTPGWPLRSVRWLHRS